MRIHPLPVRITHWTNAVAMTVMIASGWQIYNASPLFAFTFPAWLTLGGHIGRRLFPLRPHDVWRDATQALHFRLPHDSTHYNAVQRLLYVLAGCGIALAIVSGLVIWKPVQLYPLTFLLGGYEIARRIHFLAMSGIVAFIVVHLALVAIVPSMLRPMVTGRVP